MTNYDRVIKAIKDADKPLQRADIRESTQLGDNILGVVLHKLCEQGKLIMAVYNGMPNFYTFTAWEPRMDSWDPVLKEWKDVPTNQDQPTGVPNTGSSLGRNQ